MQPFFDHTHEPDGYNDRNDVALVTGTLNSNEVADQVPAGNNAVCDTEEAVDRICVCNIPAVQECGVDHQKTDDRAQEQVAAEDSCCGNSDDDRQIRESSICDDVQELEPVAVAEAQAGDLRECLDETHHQTGCNDGGKDRNEDVTDGLQSLSPDRSLGRGGCLDVVLCAGCNAGDCDEFIKDFVDGTGADDQLELSVGLEHALDAVDFLESRLVYFPVISDNETQSCRAVRGGDHVCAAADIISDLLRTFVVIQCHTNVFSYTLFYFNFFHL